MPKVFEARYLAKKTRARQRQLAAFERLHKLANDGVVLNSRVIEASSYVRLQSVDVLNKMDWPLLQYEYVKVTSLFREISSSQAGSSEANMVKKKKWFASLCKSVSSLVQGPC